MNGKPAFFHDRLFKTNPPIIIVWPLATCITVVAEFLSTSTETLAADSANWESSTYISMRILPLLNRVGVICMMTPEVIGIGAVIVAPFCAVSVMT